MYKTAIFDLDGTLTDSGDAIMHCGKLALKELGYAEPSRETLLLMRGPSLMWSFTTLFGLSMDETLKAIDLYRSYYPTEGIKIGYVYDGVFEMLDGLRAKGIKVFVATSKYEKHARMVCDYFGLTEHLDGIYGTGDPEKHEKKADIINKIMTSEGGLYPAVMTGDKNIDVEAGKATNLTTIAVRYGYAIKGELEESEPDYIVETPSEIYRIITNE